MVVGINAPSRNPSAAPTISPTVVLYNCAGVCNMLRSTSVGISFNKKLFRTSLSRNFALAFDISNQHVPTNSLMYNILELRDESSNDHLIGVNTVASGRLRITYRGSLLGSQGPEIFPNQWTRVHIESYYGLIQFRTSVDPNNIMNYDVSANELPGVPGRIFNVFLSNAVDTTAGGSIRSFNISGTPSMLPP